jgi:hypothetical protein
MESDKIFAYNCKFFSNAIILHIRVRIMAIALDISNFKNCIEDAKRAMLANDFAPQDPTNYSQLRGRLEASRNNLPPLYRERFFQPYLNKLDQIGEQGFNSILIAGSDQARLMLDIAQAILQRGEGYNWASTDAFEEVVSDLYDGFLSAEDRRGIERPDKDIMPPLVKWGDPSSWIYTWPVDDEAIEGFDVRAAIVNLPTSHAKSALLGWSALGHETAGHDIIHAYKGLRHELSRSVQDALDIEKLKNGLPDYWSTRLDETTSDILGILNMGPMLGLGIIGYFRALNDVRRREPKLSNTGDSRDVHPAHILRGYLAAFTVKLLRFKGADDWSRIIRSETDKDLSKVVLEGNEVNSDEAIRSAEIVASTIFNTKFESLDNHALGEIQNWHDYDEAIVQKLIPSLTSMESLSSDISLEGIYAAHVVAASIEAALSKDADITYIFNRMINILKDMHSKNPTWGPLFVRHPGNVTRHFFSYDMEV